MAHGRAEENDKSDGDEDFCSDGEFQLDASTEPSQAHKSESTAIAADEADDDELPECAVCTDAVWEPIKLPLCGHVFCRACISEVVRRSSSHLIAEGNETEGNGDGGGPRCPLCRHPILATTPAGTPRVDQWLAQAPVDAVLERRLSDKFPEIWERRRAEAELRAASKFTVLVGNRVIPPARGADPDEVRWTIFVEVLAPSGWAERPAPRGAAAGGAAHRSEGASSAAGGSSGAAAATNAHATAGGAQAAANAAVTHMLVQCMRVTLPEEQTPGGSGGGCGGYVEIEDAPYELRGVADRNHGEFAAPVVVFWQRRLKLPPLAVDLSLSLQPGGSVTRHEMSLAEGLTLSRVLERTRPKAVVGVGTAAESRIY